MSHFYRGFLGAGLFHGECVFSTLDDGDAVGAFLEMFPGILIPLFVPIVVGTITQVRHMLQEKPNPKPFRLWGFKEYLTVLGIVVGLLVANGVVFSVFDWITST